MLKEYTYRLLLFAVLLVPYLVKAADMPFAEVGPGIYAFIGQTGGRTYENEGMNVNAGFVVTGDGVVVIDSGSSYQLAKRIHGAIQRVTKQPVAYVINTGSQAHRWLGNSYFKEIGATIIAHKKVADDISARGAEQLTEAKRDLRERIVGTSITLPDQTFDQEKVLRLGGTELRILHFSGGHTPGDSVVWLPKSRILFAGDLVYVDRLLAVLPISSTKNWLASFDSAERLAPRLIVPGHGHVCDLSKARRETKDYLILLRTHMGLALRRGMALDQAVKTLDQSRFSSLQNYDSLKGVNASRTYLEMEAE